MNDKQLLLYYAERENELLTFVIKSSIENKIKLDESVLKQYNDSIERLKTVREEAIKEV